MSAPSFDPLLSDNTKVHLIWTAPTGVNAGGSSITGISYDLQYSPAPPTAVSWTSLSSTTNTYAEVTVLTTGSEYIF